MQAFGCAREAMQLGMDVHNLLLARQYYDLYRMDPGGVPRSSHIDARAMLVVAAPCAHYCPPQEAENGPCWPWAISFQVRSTSKGL